MPIKIKVKKIRLPIILLITAVIAGIGGAFYAPLVYISAALIIVAVLNLIKYANTIALAEKEHLEIHKIIKDTTKFEAFNNRDVGVSEIEITETHLGSDPETGFITYPVFSAILEAKVATARRRLWPVTVVQLQLSFIDMCEPTDAEVIASIISFSSLIRLTLREADVIARIGRGRFGMILEDTDEEGAAWVAERIQVAQVKAGSVVVHKISAGVAGYPTNGASSKELMARSTLALEHAISTRDEPGIGKVVVAPTVPYNA